MAITNYFIDDTTSGGDGLTPSGAFASLDSIKTGRSAGDRCWVRRTHLEDYAADFDFNIDGTADEPIQVIGWPRAAKSSTADFVNSSREVSGVASNDISHFSHVGRDIELPNGETAFIVTSGSTSSFTIDRLYAGANGNGTFTILADDYYTEAQALLSTYPELSGWNADPDEVPGWNCTNSDVNTTSDNFLEFRGLRFLSSGKPPFFTGGINVFLKNCFIQVSTNHQLLNVSTYVKFQNVIFKGIDGASNYLGPWEQTYFDKCAFLNTGTYSVYNGSCVYNTMNDCYFDGLSTYDLSVPSTYYITVKNSNPSTFIFNVNNMKSKIFIENYNRDVNDHRILMANGSILSNDGSGVDVNLRTGGAILLAEIAFNTNSPAVLGRRFQGENTSSKEFANMVFEHEFKMDACTKSFRYYVNSVGVLSASQLWLEAEYVNYYSDETAWSNTLVKSSNTIAARTSVDDWSQYLQISNITVPYKTKVIVRCFCSYYHASNKIYVDPKVSLF